MACGDIVDLRPTPRPGAVPAPAEPERLLGLGAVRADVGRTGVLADPEGNEFCLLKRRLDPLAKEIP